MLERKGRQVSVGHQVSSCSRDRQERAKNLSMTVGRQRDPGGWAIEPLFHLPPGIYYRPGMLENARIGDQTDKPEQTRPGQPDRCGSIQPIVEPGSRRRMLSHRGGMGIDEQVSIHEDHKWDSPSAIASTSATSSMLPTRQRPRETSGVQ